MGQKPCLKRSTTVHTFVYIINVLAFEYYGHGAAVGTRITLGYRERDDFFGALAYAKRQAPDTHLGVLAYSMGAAVAILCSAHAPEVEALIADSAFATHTSVIHYNVRRTLRLSSSPPLVWLATSITWLGDRLLGWLMGYRFHQVEPVREIAYLAPRPLLLIHGGRDQMVDPLDAQILATAAGTPTTLWIVPEADHCGAYFADRAAYIERVLSFFATHLPMPRQEFQVARQEEEATVRPAHWP
jgi:fermentation-respiration switch protein FrsA (DUF1100 family)